MQIEYAGKLPFTYKDDPAILKEWGKDYQNKSKAINEMTRAEYLNQSTEIDAIAFSAYLADKLLNVKQIILEEIEAEVQSRIKVFKKINFKFKI